MIFLQRTFNVDLVLSGPRVSVEINLDRDLAHTALGSRAGVLK